MNTNDIVRLGFDSYTWRFLDAKILFSLHCNCIA